MAAALTSLVLVAGGCTTGSLSTGTTQAGGTPAFQRVLDRVGADGTIDKTTALEAFALAFTPLPGVSVPSGPAQVIPSGSGPLRWVLSHFSELSAAQQRAVRAAIGHPSGNALAEVQGPVLLAGTEQARFESLVDEAKAYYAGRLPAGGLVVPQPEYFVTLNNRNLYDANAYTFAVDAQGSEVGPVAECQIYFNPKVRQASAAAQREAAFHEVFHCYQARMVATLNLFNVQSANGKGPGSWLVEGGALWAGDEGAGAAPLAASWWKQYFATPTTSLFKRTYDATGFFSHLREAGFDVYAAFPAAEQAIANGNVAAC